MMAGRFELHETQASEEAGCHEVQSSEFEIYECNIRGLTLHQIQFSGGGWISEWLLRSCEKCSEFAAGGIVPCVLCIIHKDGTSVPSRLNPLLHCVNFSLVSHRNVCTIDSSLPGDSSPDFRMQLHHCDAVS